MLVRRIIKFIEDLACLQEQLNVTDLEFLATFQNNFRSRNANESLNKADYTWLSQQFAERWKYAQDDFQTDYTYTIDGLNAPWFQLAKVLAFHLKKPVLVILIPAFAKVDAAQTEAIAAIIDPRKLFLSKDNRTWCLNILLIDLLQNPYCLFGMFDKTTEANVRAFSLMELKRIRSKQGIFQEITIAKKNYTSLWEAICKSSLPRWTKSGSCPRFLLPVLLEVIENYFESIDKFTNKADKDEFKNSFSRFMSYLEHYPIRDVNYLYGIEIYVHDKPYYLVEILLDCLENKEDLSDKLRGVASWICSFDLSFTSNKEQLSSVYVPFKTGAYFDLSYFFQLFQNLNVERTSVAYIPYILIVRDLSRLLSVPEVDQLENLSLVVEKIRHMYAVRWDKIKGTYRDYTQLQGGVNYPWIRLAQYLAGVGLIDSNYYTFLMHTLKLVFEPGTGEPITSHPLSHYVLAANSESLIYLKNCVRSQKINHFFGNCNAGTPILLNQLELKRIRFADPEFHRYFLKKQNDENYQDPSLSRRTVGELVKLVNGTFNVYGLTNDTISAEDYEIATLAFDAFMTYRESDPQEKQNLARQRITLDGKQLTVQEILDQIQALKFEDKACISCMAKWFAQLAKDYNKWVKFSPDINDAIHKRLGPSAKKVYSEYRHISEHEALKRLVTLVVSLMTHSFNYYINGENADYLGYSNTVSHSAIAIINYLKQNETIEKGENLDYQYAHLCERVLKAAYVRSKKSGLESKKWLESIKNEDIFAENKLLCIQPELLCTVLFKYSNKDNRLLNEFSKQILKLLVQENSYIKKCILINIEFQKFIAKKEVSNEELDTIFNAIKASGPSFPRPATLDWQTNFIHRVASALLLDCNPAPSLFGAIPGQYKVKYLKTCEELYKKITEYLAPQEFKLLGLIAFIQSLFNKSHAPLHIDENKRCFSNNRIHAHERSDFNSFV